MYNIKWNCFLAYRLFGQFWTITTFWQFNIIFSSKTIISKSQCKMTTSSPSMCSFRILFQITLISFIFEAYSSFMKIIFFCKATVKNCEGLWILYYFLVNKLAANFMNANRRQEKPWVREKSILIMTQGQHDIHIHFTSPCLLSPIVAK